MYPHFISPPFSTSSPPPLYILIPFSPSRLSHCHLLLSYFSHRLVFSLFSFSQPLSLPHSLTFVPDGVLQTTFPTELYKLRVATVLTRFFLLSFHLFFSFLLIFLLLSPPHFPSVLHFLSPRARPYKATAIFRRTDVLALQIFLWFPFFFIFNGWSFRKLIIIHELLSYWNGACT